MDTSEPTRQRREVPYRLPPTEETGRRAIDPFWTQSEHADPLPPVSEAPILPDVLIYSEEPEPARRGRVVLITLAALAIGTGGFLLGRAGSGVPDGFVSIPPATTPTARADRVPNRGAFGGAEGGDWGALETGVVGQEAGGLADGGEGETDGLVLEAGGLGLDAGGLALNGSVPGGAELGGSQPGDRLTAGDQGAVSGPPLLPGVRSDATGSADRTGEDAPVGTDASAGSNATPPVRALPTALAIRGGSARVGVVSMVLPDSISAWVGDADGASLAGVAVDFGVLTGGGAAQPAIGVTDENGIARVAWVLGPEVGEQRLSVSVRGAPEIAASVMATAGARLLSTTPTIAAGGAHTCALEEDGALRCWGMNDQGQLARGAFGNASAAEAAVAPPRAFARVTAGVFHGCGLDQDGRAFCWGENASGQLGDGTMVARNSPVAVSGGLRFTRIEAGNAHTCALDQSRAAWCWGENFSGQLGDGSRSGRTAPVRVAGGRTFADLAAGWTHTCGITASREAWCWGGNSFGQVGDGTVTDRTSPTRVSGDGAYLKLETGSAHTCAISTDQRVSCWGQNSSGQLGDGSTQDRASPVRVSGLDAASGLAAGGVHTCALEASGSVRCWGQNRFGQLGDGTVQARLTPVVVIGGTAFRSIDALGSHTCGVARSGERYCWGYNAQGQLGDGSRGHQLAPVRVRSGG